MRALSLAAITAFALGLTGCMSDNNDNGSGTMAGSSTTTGENMNSADGQVGGAAGGGTTEGADQ